MATHQSHGPWRPLMQLLVLALLLVPASATAQAPARAGVVAAPLLRQDAVSRIVARRSPSVVFIHTIADVAPGESQEGIGSGVVIDDEGLIVTNAHVVEGSTVVHVRTPDGDREAAVVAVDAAADLALLRLSGLRGLARVPLGDSDTVPVGAFVIAIGNPYGLHHTASLGIVSGRARPFPGGTTMLQTDAAISPGSSGGALLDLQGRLVGLTTLMFTGEAKGNIGLNFAIPSNVVKAALPRLEAAARGAMPAGQPRHVAEGMPR